MRSDVTDISREPRDGFVADSMPSTDPAALAPELANTGRLGARIAALTLELEATRREVATRKRELDAIVRSVADVIYVTDQSRRTERCIHRDLGLSLGYRAEEIRAFGDSVLLEVLHPEDRQIFLDRMTDPELLREDACTELVCRARHRDGHYRWLCVRETVLARDENGRVKEILGIVSDVTEIHVAREQISLFAGIDELTGLANSRSFRQRLSQLVSEGERGRRFAVVMCDLDHFRLINDSYGSSVGDKLLVRVARALVSHVRTVDVVARHGGEEFAILLVDVEERRAAELAERLREAVAAITQPTPLTASFGVCAYAPELEMDADALVSAADDALYRAKHTGRDRVVTFEFEPRRASSVRVVAGTAVSPESSRSINSGR